ncbi:MAG: hypothetical protein V1859_07880 [archaeon]
MHIIMPLHERISANIKTLIGLYGSVLKKCLQVGEESPLNLFVAHKQDELRSYLEASVWQGLSFDGKNTFDENHTLEMLLSEDPVSFSANVDIVFAKKPHKAAKRAEYLFLGVEIHGIKYYFLDHGFIIKQYSNEEMNHVEANLLGMLNCTPQCWLDSGRMIIDNAGNLDVSDPVSMDVLSGRYNSLVSQLARFGKSPTYKLKNFAYISSQHSHSELSLELQRATGKAIMKLPPEIVDAISVVEQIIGIPLESLKAAYPCAVHGDFHPSNIGNYNGVIRFYDVETASIGACVYDLSRLIGTFQVGSGYFNTEVINPYQRMQLLRELLTLQKQQGIGIEISDADYIGCEGRIGYTQYAAVYSGLKTALWYLSKIKQSNGFESDVKKREEYLIGSSNHLALAFMNLYHMADNVYAQKENIERTANAIFNLYSYAAGQVGEVNAAQAIHNAIISKSPNGTATAANYLGFFQGLRQLPMMGSPLFAECIHTGNAAKQVLAYC